MCIYHSIRLSVEFWSDKRRRRKKLRHAFDIRTNIFIKKIGYSQKNLKKLSFHSLKLAYEAETLQI